MNKMSKDKIQDSVASLSVKFRPRREVKLDVPAMCHREANSRCSVEEKRVVLLPQSSLPPSGKDVGDI